MPGRTRFGDLLGLGLFLALCLVVYLLGAAVVATSIESWYSDLDKPSFTPPDEAFALVWAILYILMAVAAWRVWRGADRDTARGPLTLFALQLALSLGWIVVFFGLRTIDAAVATIVVLDVGVLVTMLAFRTIDGLAALLMLPYFAWVLFETVLIVAIWQLNPTF